MDEALQFLIRHGYVLLFGWVLIEQMGLPIPAVPLLLAAGGLAGTGRMNFALAVCAAMIAVVAADLFWYYLGRNYGGRVLQLLCRISLEPDSCVRRTENVFARHGARSLLLAKFVPGLNTAAPTMAGSFRMPIPRFLVCDFLGGLLWVAVFIGLGYAFSDQLEQVASAASRWGGGLIAALGAGLIGYVGWKYVQRRRFLSRLRTARVTPQELMAHLAAGSDVMIIDLRHTLDVESRPFVIPGALRISVEELENRHGEIPRDRDIVVYCS